MAKSKTVDDIREPVSALQFIPETASLVASGIIEIVNGGIVWREGHLAHLARLYQANPMQTERDYHDDVVTAQTYSQSEWERLIG